MKQVCEIAAEIGVTSKDILDFLKERGHNKLATDEIPRLMERIIISEFKQDEITEFVTAVICDNIEQFNAYQEQHSDEQCVRVCFERDYICRNMNKLVVLALLKNSIDTKLVVDINRRIQSRCGINVWR